MCISGDRRGVVDPYYEEMIIRAISDGSERWRTPIGIYNGDVVASPRGGFFVPLDDQVRGGRVVELNASWTEVRSTPGRFSAARGELLSVMDGPDIVVVDGKGQEIERIKPAGTGDYVAAPGLCDGAVVYFRNRDRTVWWHPLGGSEHPVVTIGEKMGFSERGIATAGATLTVPPRCTDSLVFVQDWAVTAYRIPRS